MNQDALQNSTNALIPFVWKDADESDTESHKTKEKAFKFAGRESLLRWEGRRSGPDFLSVVSKYDIIEGIKDAPNDVNKDELHLYGESKKATLLKNGQPYFLINYYI